VCDGGASGAGGARGAVDTRVTVLKLDYDVVRLPMMIGKVGWLARLMRWRVTGLTYARTRRGWHVEIWIGQRICPRIQVAAQAILGSDPAREAFNLVRARKLRRMDGWVRRGGFSWNVLYREKLT